jgi:hypothetical protein
MNTSDILRKLADYIDAQQQPESAEILQPEEVEVVEPEGDGSGLAQQPDDIMIPPLQLKIELLKKATGVENVYDEPESEDEEQYSYDELEHIKRNAGISVVALDALGDDEPLDV